MAMAAESHHTWFKAASSAIHYNESSTSHLQGIWSPFESTSEQNTSIAPHLLLTHTSSDQCEQSTQSSTLSPTEPVWDCVPESSIALNELGDDFLWPMLRSDSFKWQQEVMLEHGTTQQQDTAFHRTDGQMVADHIEANDDAPRAVIEPQPAQRKRGRPRLSSAQSRVQIGNTSQSHLSSARESHLEKNRIAAAKCRERSKQHTAGLIAQASDLSSKNKALKADETALREQILNLKHEVLQHAGCGSWAIDEYVSQCAGDILGVKGPSVQSPVSRRDSTQTKCDSGSTNPTDSSVCESVFKSPNGQGSMDFSIEADEYESLQLFSIDGNMEKQTKFDLMYL
jgi:hypothetical protein